MPMNKRTESIRLKHLQDIYYEKLQGIAYDVYDEQLHNLIIRPEELDADIHLYFRHTQPSLQDFYSRYASQWEYFHEMNEASDAKFLQFLKNSAYPFSMKYHLVDLNVKYYLQRFDAISPHSKEWKALRTLFFDKWHTLLSNNEFNYQMEHIERLCDDFYRLQLSLAKNLPVRGGSRLVWLLRNHKQIAEQILEYEETIKRNPVIRELVEILGKKHQSSRKRFKMTAGIHREQIRSHATRSDITGICEGNDLNSLLPLEYCYLAEKSLQPIFFERFIEKRLQVIDYQSHEKQTINDKKTIGNEVSEEAEGPFNLRNGGGSRFELDHFAGLVSGSRDPVLSSQNAAAGVLIVAHENVARGAGVLADDDRRAGGGVEGHGAHGGTDRENGKLGLEVHLFLLKRFNCCDKLVLCR